MGFWPYLRQAHMSEESPSAGTSHTTLFCWFFLHHHTQKQHHTQNTLIQQYGFVVSQYYLDFRNREEQNKLKIKKIKKYLLLDREIWVFEEE